MSADANLPADVFSAVNFDEFYDHATPVVFGYLLRLCGGNRDEAWDLTQDSWMSVVDRLKQGQSDRPTVGFLLSVARAISINGGAGSVCSASSGWCGRATARPTWQNRPRAMCSSISRSAPRSIGSC